MSDQHVPGIPATVNPGSELLTSCVHCGLCLEVCPTYQLTGDENNSPRGRLRLWREEAEGRLPEDPWTARYTEDCVGCLACETACPANVPYGTILEQTRQAHVTTHRSRVPWKVRVAAAMASHPAVFQWSMAPIRMLRRWGLLRHRLSFPGRPAVVMSTADYAARLMKRHHPTGPKVALLTGCLMEAVFREINFATVRVLIHRNFQVVVPERQTCCGALHEHAGLQAAAPLRERNRQAFEAADADVVLSNSSGCGLALGHALHPGKPVRDVLDFLGDQQLAPVTTAPENARVYVDLPCHLVHGQKLSGIPRSVLDATGYRWELAPQARDCCGSGGIYHLRRPENAEEILRRKAAFLNSAAGDPVILATSNHVCMMQWHSARAAGLVSRPFEVRHVIQLLDPGPGEPSSA